MRAIRYIGGWLLGLLLVVAAWLIEYSFKEEP